MNVINKNKQVGFGNYDKYVECAESIIKLFNEEGLFNKIDEEIEHEIKNNNKNIYLSAYMGDNQNIKELLNIGESIIFDNISEDNKYDFDVNEHTVNKLVKRLIYDEFSINGCDKNKYVTSCVRQSKENIIFVIKNTIAFKVMEKVFSIDKGSKELRSLFHCNLLFPEPFDRSKMFVYNTETNEYELKKECYIEFKVIGSDPKKYEFHKMDIEDVGMIPVTTDEKPDYDGFNIDTSKYAVGYNHNTVSKIAALSWAEENNLDYEIVFNKSSDRKPKINNKNDGTKEIISELRGIRDILERVILKKMQPNI